MLTLLVRPALEMIQGDIECRRSGADEKPAASDGGRGAPRAQVPAAHLGPAAGIWLAMSIADLRKTQDCVLMGRPDCARISSPHS
jgi:hypothetical protein